MRERRQPPYTTRDAIRYLRDAGVDILPDSLRALVRRGRLQPMRTAGGTQYLYTRQQLDALIAARRVREREHEDRARTSRSSDGRTRLRPRGGPDRAGARG